MQVHEGAMAITSIAGTDLDPQAVKRGMKRVAAKFPELLSEAQALEVRAYQADTCCQAASIPGVAWTLCRMLIGAY